ncbi:PRC-barrel domain-containing protein [Hyphomicrobium sp. 2TAF46]|uniref:PRC-barrel domain-containing protein n=1 Tax=Hyphomicrobium sp. 2TAF46 TaxID=3233019 RepID=UPI003F8E307C
MISLKLRSALGIALAFSIGFAMQTMPGSAQDQQQPPAEADQAAPADAGAAGAADTMPSAEQPEQHDGSAAATEAPAQAAEPQGGAAETQPAQPEAPAAAAEAPAATTAAVPASDLKIGAAVYGADGAKIGEVNGVKSDHAGKVQEILVTDGVAAGINAKVFAISADKITSVSDGVKLSLSSEEAKKLPIIDNSNG